MQHVNDPGTYEERLEAMSPSVTVIRCRRCHEPLAPGVKHECKAPKEKRPATGAWHRTLKSGRMELCCWTPTHHMRVSGTDEQCWRFVELFEEITGLTVQSDRRPRRRIPASPGQLTIESGTM